MRNERLASSFPRFFFRSTRGVEAFWDVLQTEISFVEASHTIADGLVPRRGSLLWFLITNFYSVDLENLDLIVSAHARNYSTGD